MRRTAIAALVFSAAAVAADQPNAVFILRNSQVAPAAFRDFRARVGADACDCILSGENLAPERLSRARLLFLEHPSEPFLARMKSAATDAVSRGMVVVTDVPEMVQRAWNIELPYAPARRIMPYWQNGGLENMLGFFLAAYKEAGGPESLVVPPPKETPRSGVYHPQAPQVFPDLASYLGWYRPAKPGLGRLAVVTFYQTYLNKGDLAFVDALIKELENEGLAAAGVFGWPHSTLEGVFATPPDDPMKVMLSFTLSISKPDDGVLLEKQNVHVINLMATRDSYETWAKSDRGVTPERVSSSLSAPERLGATDPIMVATTEPGGEGDLERTMPIPERVQMAARRARRWVTLAEKPNSEKRLVMLYYNNPPGKGNIGASYLNIAPSIYAALDTLSRDGYLTGSELPTAQQILDMLEKSGRNIEAWAPGELNRMVEQSGVTLLPIEDYKRWFNELPEQFQRSINERWGKPEACELMCLKSGTRAFFVIPGFRFGNVLLGPQLLRASAAEYTNVQHSGTLPPHHGYVASYLYYRHHFKADAVIHMGRHGTLEWLPGKSAGQAGWDSSEAILGDLPNLNYYIMDGDWEAIQARRRGAAVDLSHLTPMLVYAGGEGRFAALHEAATKWEETHETSPLLAAEYAAKAMAEIKRLDLGRQLGLDESNPEKVLPKIHEFLDAAEEAPLPLGLATVGQAPTEDRQRAGLLAFLTTAFQPDEAKTVRAMLPGWSDAVFDGLKPEVPNAIDGRLRERVFRALDDAHNWIARLRASPPRELAMMLKVLRGEYLPSGLVGDPLAVPDALPSGRNLHQGDPALLPSKVGWEVGKKLANQLLDRHKREHGRYPERISMILWGGETERHQGAMEAQALYLMGIEPEWNARGVPDRLKLIPDAELGRPRVNIVFNVSGGYRDALADKIVMLDRAARLAASAGDNAISRHSNEVKQHLLAGGMAEADASELSGARVFTTAPGSYGIGISRFVEQSRDKDEPETMAQLWLTKMNYVYTEKVWGQNTPKLLERQLRGNEAILHSRSSNLYGAIDNDDVFEWMGGLRVASEAAGAKPELLIHNLRRAGQEKLEDARKFLATELNTRNWNPKWIAEMQKEGYSGAREMMRSVEYLYGWQATAPDSVSPTVWKKMYDVYVADEYELGMKQFFDKASPAAKQVMVARLLEIDRQGTYQFTSAERKQLVKEYVRLVAAAGVACSGNVCGNRKLQAAVLSEASRIVSDNELTPGEVAHFRQQLERAARPAQVSVNRASLKRANGAPRATVNTLKDWKVGFVKIANFTRYARRVAAENPLALVMLFGASLGLGVLIAWTRRRPQAWSRLQLGR